jgi:hypothetical protein
MDTDKKMQEEIGFGIELRTVIKRRRFAQLTAASVGFCIAFFLGARD